MGHPSREQGWVASRESGGRNDSQHPNSPFQRWRYPRIASWGIFSRPYGTDRGVNLYPGLRPGLLSAVPSGLNSEREVLRHPLKAHTVAFYETDEGVPFVKAVFRQAAGRAPYRRLRSFPGLVVRRGPALRD